jgi:excisionase family DNA binding protein
MDKATLTIKEMGKYLGIGQSKAYELASIADAIHLPVLRFGKKTIKIPVAALNEWMKSEEAQKALAQKNG